METEQQQDRERMFRCLDTISDGGTMTKVAEEQQLSLALTYPLSLTEQLMERVCSPENL